MPTINSWASQNPAEVAKGGTGLNNAGTAYGVLAAGTTSTSAFQNIGTGSVGQVLTSNGTGVLPSFQAAGGGGSGSWTFLSSASATGVNTLELTSGFSDTYLTYLLTLDNVTITSASRAGGNYFIFQVSYNGGATYSTVNYSSTAEYRWTTSTIQQEPELSDGNWIARYENTTAAVYNGQNIFYNFRSTTEYPFIEGTNLSTYFDIPSSARRYVRTNNFGSNSVLTKVDAIRLFVTQNTITPIIASGTIRLYGWTP